MPDKKILLVEGGVDALDIQNILNSFNYESYIVSSGQEAIEKILDWKPDLILIDVALEGNMDFVELALKIKDIKTPFIFLGADAEDSIIKRATPTNPSAFLFKPFNKNILKTKIELALYKQDRYHKKSKKIALTKAINKILKESLTCKTVNEVAKLCLKVAEELTSSKFGFLGEVNTAGRFDTIAISNPGWNECIMADKKSVKLIKNMELRGYWARAIKTGKPVIINDHRVDSGRLGEPEGHPIIKSFLSIPLNLGDKTRGMIALANKESGYTKQDQQTMETLSLTILQVLNHKKTELKIEESEKHFRAVAESAIDAIITTDINGTIKFFNQGVLKIFGYTPDKLQDAPLTLLMPPRQQNKYHQQLERFKNTAEHKLIGKLVKTTGLKNDGTEFPLEMTLSKWKSGKKTFFTSIIRDLTEKKTAEEKLRWSDSRLRMGMDMAKLVYWEYDTKQDIFTFDDQFYSLYHTSSKKEGTIQMSSQEYISRFIPPEEHKAVKLEVAKALQNDNPYYVSTMQHSIIRGDGEKRHIIVRIKARTNDKGEIVGTMGVNQDITEIKNFEIALKKSDQLLHNIINFMPDATFTIDKEGKVITWNRAMEKMTGIKAEDMLGKEKYEYAVSFYGKRRPLLINMVNESPDKITEYYPQIKMNGKLLNVETEVLIKDELKTVWGVAGPLQDHEGKSIGAIETVRDISEMKEYESKLINEIEEKEALLKEIHHRTKNNLMVISSLLNLQANYIKDKESQDIFIKSQNRARSMAIIHERLYSSKDLKKIDYKDYIQSLCTELFHLYVDDPSQIKLIIDMDSIYLDVNIAIPLGLIINELITNSLKYGFPDGRNGTIMVKFHKHDDKYEFIIKDNGVGFPEDLNYMNTNSLGMQLVRSFTEQIDGEIELKRINGTEFNITFREPEYSSPR